MVTETIIYDSTRMSSV